MKKKKCKLVLVRCPLCEYEHRPYFFLLEETETVGLVGWGSLKKGGTGEKIDNCHLCKEHYIKFKERQQKPMDMPN